jgi:hypothetical protein
VGRPSLRAPIVKANRIPRASAARKTRPTRPASISAITAATSGLGTGSGHQFGVDRSGRRSKNGGQEPVVPPVPPTITSELSSITPAVHVSVGAPVSPVRACGSRDPDAVSPDPELATTHTSPSWTDGKARDRGKSATGTSLIAERLPCAAIRSAACRSPAAGQPNAHGDTTVKAPITSTAVAAVLATQIRSRLEPQCIVTYLAPALIVDATAGGMTGELRRQRTIISTALADATKIQGIGEDATGSGHHPGAERSGS